MELRPPMDKRAMMCVLGGVLGLSRRATLLDGRTLELWANYGGGDWMVSDEMGALLASGVVETDDPERALAHAVWACLAIERDGFFPPRVLPIYSGPQPLLDAAERVLGKKP